MINGMWGQINSPDAMAAIEGSASMQQVRIHTVFDKADSDRIRQSLPEYVRAADAEWLLVASGQTYPEADNALQRLYAT
jgi:hypothetical protein